jgi:hypothetical protein
MLCVCDLLVGQEPTEDEGRAGVPVAVTGSTGAEQGPIEESLFAFNYV